MANGRYRITAGQMAQWPRFNIEGLADNFYLIGPDKNLANTKRYKMQKVLQQFSDSTNRALR